MNKPDDDPKARVALFEKREIRRTMHHDEWWFAITDIIAALTGSADPSDYWKKMRKRDPDLGKALQGGDNLSPPLLWKLQATGHQATEEAEGEGRLPCRAGRPLS